MVYYISVVRRQNTVHHLVWTKVSLKSESKLERKNKVVSVRMCSWGGAAKQVQIAGETCPCDP